MEADDVRTIAQTVHRRLRSDILFGRLAPDRRLRLGLLCNAYAVGMSPLREALAQLVGKGLVIQDEQRGFRVAPISRTDLQDMTAVRVRLESMALRDAIGKGDDAWEAAILAAHHRLARCPRTPDKLVDETWERLHRGFHFALVDACGSPWLLSFCHTLHDQFDRYRRLAVRESGRHPAITNVHGEIVAAVLARDEDRAARLLERHIEEAAEQVVLMGAGRLFDRVPNAAPVAGTPLANSPAGARPVRRRGSRDNRQR
jgi:GntR family carbon starvation induced transcriptional regulator